MMSRIESTATNQLVEQTSLLTGETPATAFEIAMRERLELMEHADEEVERLTKTYALVKELGAMFREAPDLITDRGELLYDEHGMPK